MSKRIIEDGKDINSPIKVVDLLELCCENRGEIVTKDMIIDKLWSCEEEYSEALFESISIS